MGGKGKEGKRHDKEWLLSELSLGCNKLIVPVWGELVLFFVD